MTAPEPPASVLGLTLLLVMSSGCSFLLSQGPPTHPRRGEELRCSEGVGWPVIDTVVAVANGITAGVALTLKNDGAQRPITVGSSLASMSLWGASAIYGYRNAEDCTRARTMIVDLPQAAAGDQVVPTEAAPGTQSDLPVITLPAPRSTESTTQATAADTSDTGSTAPRRSW